jgi:hypothetical protein
MDSDASNNQNGDEDGVPAEVIREMIRPLFGVGSATLGFYSVFRH